MNSFTDISQLQKNHTISKVVCIPFCTPAALIPNVVEKLKADVDPNIPSVTLSWAPPQNTETQRSWSDVSSYHIRFKPQEREYYDEMSVDRSTTSVVLKRDSGLIPHTKSIFEVRAQCGDDLGQWRVTVSEYIRKYMHVP